MATTGERFTEFEAEAQRQNIAAMDDVTLVWFMLRIQAEVEGAPGWARTPRARTLARLAFTEIATRWIPPGIFGEAFRQLTDSSRAQGIGRKPVEPRKDEPFPYSEEEDRPASPSTGEALSIFDAPR